MEFPIPVQPENPVEILVTPSPPADTALSPALAPRQERANLHFHVVAHLAEGTTGVTHPEILDPAGDNDVDAHDDFGSGQCPATRNGVTNLRLDRLASFLLRDHVNGVSVLLPPALASQVKTQEPEGFALQRIHDFGLLSIQRYPERDELFFEPLQSAFRPASFGAVAADGDDNVIGKPMVVHRLVGSLCR